MKSMKIGVRIVLAATLVVALESCFAFRYPVSTEQPSNNRTYEVDYLFEHDGCKVYRFYDRGNYVYFTNCQGDVTAIKNDSTAERVTNSIRITYDDYNTIQKNK